MAKTPKSPVQGVTIQNGRYYRRQYLGMVDGKRKYQWHALTRISEGLPALYEAISALVEKPARVDTGAPAHHLQSISDAQSEQLRVAEELAISGPVSWLRDNWHLFKFSTEEIINRSYPYDAGTDIETISGIYFLIDSGRIVYVGQSLYVGSRLDAHYESDKGFDRVFSFDAAPPLLDMIESQYINTLKPELNKLIPSWLLRLP